MNSFALASTVSNNKKFPSDLFLVFSLILFVQTFTSIQVAVAESLPRLKSGLWQMQTNAGPMPITAEYCIDDATQDKMFEKSGDMGACSKPTVQKSGSSYLIETRCNHNGRPNTVRSKMTFSGEKSFVGETQVNGTVMQSAGTYLGSCKPGQRPGDMNIKGPGGMDFNLGDVQKMMQGFSKQMGN